MSREARVGRRLGLAAMLPSMRAKQEDTRMSTTMPRRSRGEHRRAAGAWESMTSIVPVYGRARIFISYHHEDRCSCERIIKHLNGLSFNGGLEVWTDNMIGAGDDWYSQIEIAIENATVAILLVSADFLASRFIRGEEIPRLFERRQQDGMRMFPLICSPCVWEKVEWLRRMQVRPNGGRALSELSVAKREGELAKLAVEIYDFIHRDSPGVER